MEQTFKQFTEEQNLIVNMAAAGVTSKTLNETEMVEMTVGDFLARLEEMVIENERDGIFELRR